MDETVDKDMILGTSWERERCISLPDGQKEEGKVGMRCVFCILLVIFKDASKGGRKVEEDAAEWPATGGPQYQGTARSSFSPVPDW